MKKLTRTLKRLWRMLYDGSNRKQSPQEKIWLERTMHLTVEEVIKQYKAPAVFQKELAEIINGYAGAYRDIIEVGCETGGTSFLLDDAFTKTLLDLNPVVIDLAKKAFSSLGKSANFVVADMFRMPFQEASFDIVFNAGVLEHFDEAERVNALREYNRILRGGGHYDYCSSQPL